MKRVFLLLGTNLGERFQNIENAIKLLSEEAGTLEKTSSLYETEAWGVTDQPAFLNQVISLSTALEPEALLELVLEIEKRLGRKRIRKWGERLIDIDILYYEAVCIRADHLVIPHPELHNRRFTLAPLQEIAPDFVHPLLQLTSTELLANCPDTLQVKKLQAHQASE